MSAEELNIKNALRRFLWIALCWNDHNFDTDEIIHKCKDICSELRISSIDDANALLQRTVITVHNDS